MGTIVPSPAVMFTPKNAGFAEHGAEPVNCSTKVVVMKPPLVEVVRALLGGNLNSLLPPHCGRLAGAYGGAAAGPRSATDRTPVGFHGTSTVVEVASGVTLVLLPDLVVDGVLVAGGADVLPAEGCGAGAAHAAAVISSSTPTSATTFRMLLTSCSVE